MTQRGAVFVGCRLIAIYLVVDAAIFVGSSLLSMGYMSAMAGGGRGMQGSPYEAMLKTMGMQAIVKGGMAVFVWAAAARLSRLAADPEDGDEG